jgi:hypothetical protein
MAFGHFTACAGFDKNIFRVEILRRLISVFLNDRSKHSFSFLDANISFLAQFPCHRNSHIDSVRMCQTAGTVINKEGVLVTLQTSLHLHRLRQLLVVRP